MFRLVVELAVRVTVLGVLLQAVKSVWLRVTADSRLLESLRVTGPVLGLQVEGLPKEELTREMGASYQLKEVQRQTPGVYRNRNSVVREAIDNFMRGRIKEKGIVTTEGRSQF